MSIARYVHWQDHGTWLGYLEEFPDYMTQGESLEQLQENLRDLLGWACGPRNFMKIQRPPKPALCRCSFFRGHVFSIIWEGFSTLHTDLASGKISGIRRVAELTLG
jgi:hypothetical protein